MESLEPSSEAIANVYSPGLLILMKPAHSAKKLSLGNYLGCLPWFQVHKDGKLISASTVE